MFPSANELKTVASSGWHGEYNELKKRCAQAVQMAILQQETTTGKKTEPMTRFPLKIIFHCYEWNDARDVENAGYGASKSICDSLKEMQIIPDDKKRYIESVEYRYRVAPDQEHVGVLVEMWHDENIGQLIFPAPRCREIKNRIPVRLKKAKTPKPAKKKSLLDDLK
jgi:hypothetical protein